jgi:hypothetical protein
MGISYGVLAGLRVGRASIALPRHFLGDQGHEDTIVASNMPWPSYYCNMVVLVWLQLLLTTTTTATSLSSSSSVEESLAIPWTPLRVAFDTLTAATTAAAALDATQQESIREALSTHGTISITDWPFAAKMASQIMVATQHECLLALAQRDESIDSDSSSSLPSVRVRRLVDGTTRRTIATSSSSSSSSSLLEMMQNWPSVCQTWQSAAKLVQATTTETIQALARHNWNLLESTKARMPLLSTRTTTSSDQSEYYDSIVYNTLEQVIAHGDYLQHFHSYETPPPPESNKHSSTNPDENHPWTIDWHVDQGMLVAFTPGRWTTTTTTTTNTAQTGGISSTNPHPSELYIQDRLGSVLAVDLDPTVDDVVIMLGDGFHQVSPTSTFHAVPHALQLSCTRATTATTTMAAAAAAAAAARVWSGLMVLPPPHAIHPQSLLENQKQQPVTFGEIRQRLIQGRDDGSNNNNESDDAVLDLACSRNTFRAQEVRSFPIAPSSRHRWLVATANDTDASIQDAMMCDNETQLYCRHTCQNLTVETSHHGCDETLRQLACVSNETGLIWSGTTTHGAQYQPQCVDHGTAVENVTADDTNSATTTTSTSTPPTSSGVGNSGSGSAKSAASWSMSVGLVPVWMALWTTMGG